MFTKLTRATVHQFRTSFGDEYGELHPLEMLAAFLIIVFGGMMVALATLV